MLNGDLWTLACLFGASTILDTTCNALSRQIIQHTHKIRKLMSHGAGSRQESPSPGELTNIQNSAYSLANFAWFASVQHNFVRFSYWSCGLYWKYDVIPSSINLTDAFIRCSGKVINNRIRTLWRCLSKYNDVFHLCAERMNKNYAPRWLWLWDQRSTLSEQHQPRT